MFGAEAHWFATLPSTQQTALEAAQTGAAEGVLFVAEAQTQGRGRHGHSWDSPPGAGLYASLVLRPKLAVAEAMPLTLAFGLGVADAVAEAAGVQPQLRWPNDLLLGGKKFCGLLLETAADGDRVRHAVLGIGINLRPRSFPPELADIATALDLHAAAPVDAAPLCAAVMAQLERRYRAYNAGGRSAVLAEFEARCPDTRGREVLVGGSGDAEAAYRGRTEGLDPAGYLRVRLPDGALRLVVTGDVRATP